MPTIFRSACKCIWLASLCALLIASVPRTSAQTNRRIPLAKPAAAAPKLALKMFHPGDGPPVRYKVMSGTPPSIPPLSAIERQAAFGPLPPSFIRLTPEHLDESGWAYLELYEPELVRPCCFIFVPTSGAIFLQLQARANATYYFDLGVNVDNISSGCKYTIVGPDKTVSEFNCVQKNGQKGQHLLFGFANSSRTGTATFVFQCNQPASLYSWEIAVK